VTAAAGTYATAAAERGVFTTAGQRAYAPLSAATLTLVVTGPESSGWAEQGGRAVADVDPAAAARTAVAKVRAGANAVDLDVGRWPVVLEPAAVGTLVQFLSFLGFGGRAWLEGRAFTSQRLAEAVVDPKIDLVDDAGADAVLALPVDAEGTPAQRVELISGGVLGSVVHDRHTAKQAGTASTGHALAAPNPYGPMALSAALLPGAGGSVDDLVAGCERGLLVTRFHYTNVVHPKETSITGMTRDGTFLIEDGRVTRGVRNLRFTQSIVEALASVDAVGTETGWSHGWYGGSRCPGLRLPAFTFSGSTSF
jgi:predicted Zn-dependent protease